MHKEKRERVKADESDPGRVSLESPWGPAV